MGGWTLTTFAVARALGSSLSLEMLSLYALSDANVRASKWHCVHFHPRHCTWTPGLNRVLPENNFLSVDSLCIGPAKPFLNPYPSLPQAERPSVSTPCADQVTRTQWMFLLPRTVPQQASRTSESQRDFNHTEIPYSFIKIAVTIYYYH